MRVVVAHGPDAGVRERRKVLHAAGMTCDADDCVEWGDLPMRLGAKEADLVLLFVDDANTGQNGAPWERIKEGIEIASCPVISVGDSDDGRQQASSVGAARHIDTQTLKTEIDRLAEAGNQAQRRVLGSIISVIAPLPGSGGSTLSCNLASGLIAKAKRGRVALMELTRHGGELATMLNVTPDYTIADACQRCDALDAMRLENTATEHDSGMLLLLAHPDSIGNEHLQPEAIRRLSILSRVAFEYTILSIDAGWDDCQHVAIKASDTTVVVVRPDILSLRRTTRLLQWAREHGFQDRMKVVVNRWGQSGQLSKNQIESALSVPVEAWIPEDPKRVNSALNQGLLLKDVSSMASITRRMNSLASQLNGKT